MEATHSAPPQYQQQQQADWHTGSYRQAADCNKPSLDIQLLNDDQEKAILNDLCKTAGSESTPLTTFSFISEYICSNNIDIWPGEIASTVETGTKQQEFENGEQEERIQVKDHQQMSTDS
uniref:Uncharacterized protein n=1 Tax=Anopheles christyi TaxID=43041 RepID=A0A182KIE1_9DIPT